MTIGVALFLQALVVAIFNGDLPTLVLLAALVIVVAGAAILDNIYNGDDNDDEHTGPDRPDLP